MADICITTVVDKEYMAYAPLFCYCAKKVYPSYRVLLVLRDECPYDLGDVATVRHFEDFPRYPYMSIALRFLVPPAIYKDFNHVYVTDIDMMIMPERVSIDEFHMAEMVATGLPYSNSLRNVYHYAGYKSLSGLHFASRQWFRDTEKIRQFYYDHHRLGLLGLYREWDGVMLYRMARKSGLGIPKKFKLKKRHHGIHLGNFRLFDTKTQWADRIPLEYRSQWIQWMNDPKFRDMVELSRSKNAMLDNQLLLLDDFIKNPS